MSHSPGRCAMPACTRSIPPEYLMCRHHWYMVPVTIRARVYSTLDDYKADAATIGELRAAQAEAVEAVAAAIVKGGAS